MDYQKESNTESVLASGEETSSKEQINRTTKRNVAKKRRRPRTKALRCQLKDLLEKTLLGKEQRLPDDLFSTLNDGILAAPISSIFSQLQLIFPKLPISKVEQLSPLALKSVSKITRIFRITDKLPTKSEQKEGEESLNELWLLINPKQRSQHEERTVYDNLPLNCTQSLLERRCKQFGSVVNILLPQTKRIQRRIFQSSNVNSIQHSGFAFVQFASRTAAKRFCKRYQLNSRLKRTHHSHGHRHKKAKLFLNKQNLCNSEIGDELMKDCSDEKIGENKKEEIQLIPTQPDERATNPTSFIVPQVPSLTEISRTRMRSQSVAESIMSVDESGKETDLEEKQNENILQKGIKKHRRRRKPRKATTTNNKTSNHIFSLTSLFRHIQQYKELRTNYLKLKKEKMAAIKTKIKENKQKETISKENNDDKNEENIKINNNVKKRIKKTKKRKRGIRRLMDAAELVKLETIK
uniref:RRM domain-containing protein n=1 Tax=Meloidogyne floridensis TaxID=298350 RepID=A0A915NPR6_9BILA